MVAPASSKMLLRSPCPSLWCSRTFTSSERYVLAEEFFRPLLKLVVSLPPPVSLPSPPVSLSTQPNMSSPTCQEDCTLVFHPVACATSALMEAT